LSTKRTPLRTKQDRIPRYPLSMPPWGWGACGRFPWFSGAPPANGDVLCRTYRRVAELVTLDHRIGHRPLPPIEVGDLRAGAYCRQPQSTVCRPTESSGGVPPTGRSKSHPGMTRRRVGVVSVIEGLNIVRSAAFRVRHHSRRRCDCHYWREPVNCRGYPHCHSIAIRPAAGHQGRSGAEGARPVSPTSLLRMDPADTTQVRTPISASTKNFGPARRFCLIGTQMIAKGWDLASINAWWVLSAPTRRCRPRLIAVARWPSHC